MLNLRLYLWYKVMLSSMAWLPVFFLFFSEHLSLKEVLLLEAVYYISVVILEVPSGYFSDVAGRKRTLLISAVLFAFSYSLFFFGTDFPVFAIAQILLAGGMAFKSGTDTSFHYESLQIQDRESEFGQREATIMRYSLLAGALAVLIGGFLGMIDLRLGYGLSFITALVAIVLALSFKEPEVDEKLHEAGLPFFQQLKVVLNYLRKAPLGWLFSYVILLYVLVHIPYEYYQGYLGLLEASGDLRIGNAPLISGILYAFTRTLGAWAAGNSIRWRDSLGLRNLLWGSLLLQLTVICLLGLLLHPALVLVISFRSVAMAITESPINAEIAPRVTAKQRATYFSVQSLFCRLAFFATLFLTSFFLEKASPISWHVLSNILLISAGSGLLIAIIIFGFSKKSLSLLKNGN